MGSNQEEPVSTEQTMRVGNAPAADTKSFVAAELLGAIAEAYATAERLKQETAHALIAIEAERNRLAQETIQGESARMEAERQLAEASASKDAEMAEDRKKQEEQMKLRIDHAKFSNTHAENQIQAAERKATFLVGVITVLIAIIANDAMPKLKATFLGSGGGLIPALNVGNLASTVNGILIFLVGASFLALVASYIFLLLVFVARTDEASLLKNWKSDHRPSQLIFFAVVQGLSKDAYYSRYEALTSEKVWEDVAFQAYKQARIATIKYQWFGWSWKAAFGSAVIAVIVSSLVRLFYN